MPTIRDEWRRIRRRGAIVQISGDTEISINAVVEAIRTVFQDVSSGFIEVHYDFDCDALLVKFLSVDLPELRDGDPYRRVMWDELRDNWRTLLGASEQ